MIGLKHVYLKREDLTHTGAHKINNALGQRLLAKKMGKTKLLPKPAGQHGVATATACQSNAWSGMLFIWGRLMLSVMPKM